MSVHIERRRDVLSLVLAFEEKLVFLDVFLSDCTLVRHYFFKLFTHLPP